MPVGHSTSWMILYLAWAAAVDLVCRPVAHAVVAHMVHHRGHEASATATKPLASVIALSLGLNGSSSAPSSAGYPSGTEGE
jgi:hypothetical protein